MATTRFCRACSTELRFVINGISPQLQYWYCNKCKSDVAEVDALEWQPYVTLGAEELDSEYSSLLTKWSNAPSAPLTCQWVEWAKFRVTSYGMQCQYQLEADPNRDFMVCQTAGVRFHYQSSGPLDVEIDFDKKIVNWIDPRTGASGVCVGT